MLSVNNHILALALVCLCAAADLRAQAPTQMPEVGKTVERELKGGESHNYQFTALAGHFLHAVIDQKGIDVVVGLYDARGRKLVEVDSPTGTRGKEWLNYILDTAGTYEIKVSALEKEVGAGKYSIVIHELRPAIDEDRYFIAGEKAYREALESDQQDTPAALEHIEKLIHEAMENFLRAAKKPDTNDRVAAHLNELAQMFYRHADYANALRLHREQLLVLEQMGTPRALGRAHNNIGLIFQKQGNTTLALEYFERAMKYWEKANYAEGMSMVLNNIGIIHMNTGNFAQALEAFRSSVNAKTDDDITDTDVLANIGLVYMDQKEFDKALKYLQKSFTLTEEKDGYTATDIAKVYRLKGDRQGSLEWAQKALAVLQPSEIRSLAIANTLASQAAFELGRHGDAVLYADAAILYNEKMRPAGRVEDNQELFERSLEPYYVKAEILASQNKASEALAVYERVRSKVLLDVLRSGRAERAKNIEVSEKNRLAELDSEVIRINSAISLERQKSIVDKKRVDELERELKGKRNERDAFEARLAGGVARINNAKEEFAPLDIRGVSSLIDHETVVLEYMVGDDGNTILFVLWKDRDQEIPNLRSFILDDRQNKVSGFETLVQFRRDLENGGLGFVGGAKELYRRLIKPVEAFLVGKASLIVVPDAGLWDLPFQALMDDKGKYLAEKAAISYAPSLTSLREMSKSTVERKPNPNARLLAFGNPTVGKETAERSKSIYMNSKLEPIPEAARLVRELNRMYGPGKSKVFIGPDAREETAKSEASAYRIVQFATHGVLNDDSPMYSHLVMSQLQDNPNEDGLLEARELKNLDLAADMVILSACDTARGRVSSGEGMIGMTWALFIAGAPTTVASQWKVESSSTTELMLEFHRQLLSGKVSKAEALRRAEMKVMRMPQYRHPAYWAGFVVVGDGN